MTYITLTDALIYWLKHFPIIFISILLPYFLLQWTKTKEAEARLLKMNQEKAQAELTTLRSQINPHFFFNTLSTLRAIIKNSPRQESLDFVQELSKTYRYALTSRKSELIKIREELEFIKAYTSLQSKRFGGKLIFQIDLPDKYLENKIPPLALQTLIENGIQHNIIVDGQPLRFDIYVGEGYLCVKNNLQKKDDSHGLGTGLSNLNNRFQLISGKQVVIHTDQKYFIVKLPLL